MENQQERLAWLAGFVDGEGSIYLRQVTDGRVRGSIMITNTHVPTLRVVEDLLDSLEIAYYVMWYQYNGKNNEVRYAWRVLIDGVKRVRRFLEIILPYLVTKREQGNLMYQWCTYRLGIPRGGDYRNMEWRKAGNVDFDALNKMKELNQNPQRLDAKPVRRHTRDTNGYRVEHSEDIVRPEVRASEISRNV